jgi:hypothetical protein
MSEPEVFGTSLEDDAPAPPPVVEAPVAVAPPEEPPAVDEPEAVEVNGAQMVPIAAVKAERARRQEAERQAARVPELEQWHRDAAPYVEFLKANPDFLKPKQEPVAPADPKADPELVQLAQTLDLYDAAGQPDTKRAGVMAGLIDKVAERRVQHAVQPFQQQTAQQQAQVNWARAMQYTDPEGRRVDPVVLRNLWETSKLEDVADPNYVRVLTLTAMGAERATKRPTTPVPPQALVTEASGGHPRTRPTLSTMEEKVATDRGKTATQWQDLTKGHQSGRPSQLED